MFTKALALKIFEGFSIERWNDLVRPFEIIEMDKTAEKTVLAYIIGKIEESRGVTIDWDKIIYGTFFDLLRKIALCDIKAPVQRMIREEYPDEYIKLDQWVLDQYASILPDKKLLEEFAQHLFSYQNTQDTTWRVLRAAHKFSTMREIEMISLVNEPFRIVEIQKVLQKDLGEFLDLKGLQLLLTRQQPFEFLVQIERLRFQTRWNQTPRVPKTSVLGHSYYVAALTLLMSRENSYSSHRCYNNFFSALFHDLPEAVTRDIISPVKQATDHLPGIVKEIEDRIVEKELLPFMDDSFKTEIEYFTQDEFSNRICTSEGKTQLVSFEDLQSKYASPHFKPVDGMLVRLADHIAAFIEADSSIEYGITSTHLREGRAKLLSLYPHDSVINGMNAGDFFCN